MVAPRVLRRRLRAAGAHPAWAAEVVVTWTATGVSRRQPPDIPRFDAQAIHDGGTRSPGCLSSAGDLPRPALAARARRRVAQSAAVYPARLADEPAAGHR